MIDSPTLERLRRLGAGDTIEEVCRAGGMDRAAFDAWWAAECARRLPVIDGDTTLPVLVPVQILRDGRGVPHIVASDDHDLFVAYGYAMGQDRLFQMDLRRRRPAGRLAEVLGEAGVDNDVLARTMDLPRLAVAEFERLPAETRALFEAFADGVNAAANEALGRDALPLEFDLIGYRPEPWTALDCVGCAMSWRWQLTGRPWVISVPELARRTLGAGPLYDAFIAFMREADEDSIVPRGESTALNLELMPVDSVRVPGAAGSDMSMWPLAMDAGPAAFTLDHFGNPEASPDPTGGSNNWLMAGTRSRSGKPILASDPHMPYEAASSFYEVHLSGGSFECAGAGLVGYPGLTFGRNDHLAWGITNNICSQRDLYLERDPGAVVNVRNERIQVRGRTAPLDLSVEETPRGPIVDRLLPAAARPSGPVSMRWVGQLACDWPSAQLRLGRAESIDDALTAIQGWLSPTFSLLIADDHDANGHIAFTNTGTLPVRGRPERGYRDAAEPADQWRGLIPPQGMPQTRDPSTGWLGSANNRPIADMDFPYPLGGTWDESLRHRRIGQLAQELTPHDRSTMARMHTDTHVGRADEYLPAMVAALDGRLDGVDAQALDVLRAWDREAAADSAGAAIWAVVWTRWTQAVAAARFPPASAQLVAGSMHGFAGRLLTADEAGWFASDAERDARIAAVFREAVAELRTALGDTPAAWQWGALHHKGLHHPLAGVGDLGALLDQPSRPAGGDGAVLNNVGYGGGRLPPRDSGYARNWEGIGGAGYRFVADLGDPHGSAWTVTLEGQSANPGSPNRSDQIDDFLVGAYHEIPLQRDRVAASAQHRLAAQPGGRSR